MRGLVPSSEDGRHDEVYAAYLDRLGVETSATIQQALATSPDPRFRKFLDLMSSPRRIVKIQTAAKQCGIDLAEFQNWFSKAASQIAIAEAQLRAAGIVSDMAGDAATKDEYCDRCEGLGWIAAPDGLPVETPGYRVLGFKSVPVHGKDEDGNKFPDEQVAIMCRTCPKCKGQMSVRVAGDEHARDKVLEIAGLITKGSKGASVTVNLGGASHTSAVQGALSALTIDVDLDEDVS